MPLILVMLGGALGAGARYLVARALFAGSGFPYGTLSVNLLGGLAMGLLVGVLARTGAGEAWRLFLGVGVLGGFTTFSTFSLDVVTLVERGQALPAIGYAALSVFGSLAALVLGLQLTRAAA